MIVHLFEDEKFVDTTIEKFETISEGQNRYIVFSNSEHLVHPKKTDKIEIYPNSWRKLNLNSIFNNCSLLVVHYLSPIKWFIVKNKPKQLNVVWMVWGKDAYDYFENYEQFEPRTNSYIKTGWRSKLKNTVFYDFYHKFKYGVYTINKEKDVSLKINYLTTVLPTEFELIKSEFNLNAHFIPFNYDSLNDLLTDDKNHKLGDNILIGNSATPSNNHLDVFEKLENIEQKIIVPLNYGEEYYKRLIIQKGHEWFGSKFQPLTTFMPFEDYQEIVFSCNSMVMHHIRQQGLGNILLALYVGIRVFLNNKSTTYSYFKDIGFKIYDLEQDISLLGAELKQDEKLLNRSLVQKYYGLEKIYEGTRNIVNLTN
ncbi:TDP-N-acetylfucosamine:lipid II N-acetylfucosaminyltransferase [Arenibacter certesii]|uniref:4-alpha-L-fucosyltransferase n=1 Tax=Arenibacter certesii TaxID=228955 RepID=A0A918IZN9_9FLAO|nr:TDP-N-acetylfucosamine:lipid II N-acetylfucosaminyltransferase [Arenibacter certesii]GGW38947.1 hypothetical protein GCM10007383_24650 [Arenibacter certesii]